MGVRRCLKKGSLIHLKRGLVPIERVQIGDEVLTQDGYNKIIDWFDQGERETVRINTQDGYFECTENHRMPVLKGFNKIEWVTADKLQQNDILMTSRIPIEGVKTQLPQDYDFTTNKFAGHTATKDITIPDLDVEMAWFIGIFLADGNTDERSINVYLGIDELDIANKVLKQISRFGQDLSVNIKQYTRDKMYTVVCHSVCLSAYFHQHIKQSHTDVEIPQWILEGTIDVRKAFIAGVLDGDGTASKNIVATSIYEKFITGLQRVLYSCGIESRLFLQTEIPEYRKDYNRKPIHRLRLITKHAVDKISKVPQLCKKLTTITNTQWANSFPMSFCDTDMMSKYHLDKKNQSISIDKYEQLIGKMNYCPVKVNSVVSSNKERTYDITVENQHNFYCNGYNSHNTAEMFIFEPDDYEVLFAKYGINGFYTKEEYQHHIQLGQDLDKFGIKPVWFDQLSRMFESGGRAVRKNLDHRHISNNSIMFEKKPDIDYLKLLAQIIRYEGEPGLINMEEMKRRRPNAELVNPCVSADTLIATDQGPQRVIDLLGKPFTAIINNQKVNSTPDGFFKTGNKELYLLKTKGGHNMRLTKDHKVLVQRNGIREFVPASDLCKTDMVILNKMDVSNQWGDTVEIDKAKGWLLGMLLGDGCFCDSKIGPIAMIDTWGPQGKELIDLAIKYIGMLDTNDQYISRRTGHYIEKDDKYRVQSHKLAKIAFQYGINRDKSISNNNLLLTASSCLQKSFIAGLFDSDGTVIGNTKKGVSVRLCSVTLQYLDLAQKMLTNIGINSRIYTNRKLRREEPMPDGHGGQKLYQCKAGHELCVSRNNLKIFSQHIDLKESSKHIKLDTLMNSYTRQLYKDKFMDVFESLTFDSIEDVYDCTIEEKHCFSANGILVHNCGEVILDSYQNCNLTTVNLTQFVETIVDGKPQLKIHELLNAQKLSVRAAMRMTLVTLELPQWDIKQKRDRLIGTSLTGIKDTMDLLNYTKEDEISLIKSLGDVARREAMRYAKEIRIPAPLLVTTIKPEGSLSQLAGGVSQGLHLSHSPYFIRRVRVNSNDPMVEVIKKAKWRMNPEVGTPGSSYQEKMDNARIYVVDFPVYSHAKKTKYQSNIEEQFETYFTYQKFYADHNCSNTISVKPDEWEKIPQIIYDHWDQYLGITFIPLDGGNYELAPYEECSAQDYQLLKDSMSTFDMGLLKYYDQKLYNKDLSTEESVSIPIDETHKSECVGGICPLR